VFGDRTQIRSDGQSSWLRRSSGCPHSTDDEESAVIGSVTTAMTASRSAAIVIFVSARAR